jgi:hypothetical protein
MHKSAKFLVTCSQFVTHRSSVHTRSLLLKLTILVTSYRVVDVIYQAHRDSFPCCLSARERRISESSTVAMGILFDRRVFSHVPLWTVRGRSEDMLRKNWTKLLLDWTHLQETFASTCTAKGRVCDISKKRRKVAALGPSENNCGSETPRHR